MVRVGWRSIPFLWHCFVAQVFDSNLQLFSIIKYAEISILDCVDWGGSVCTDGFIRSARGGQSASFTCGSFIHSMLVPPLGALDLPVRRAPVARLAS